MKKLQQKAKLFLIGTVFGSLAFSANVAIESVSRLNFTNEIFRAVMGREATNSEKDCFFSPKSQDNC